MHTVFDDDDLIQVREVAQKFAQHRLADGYMVREKSGYFDMDLLREMGSLGLIAPELNEDFGGIGAKFLLSGVII
ncbi:MAG: acyl-CoA dehydrogenase family protein, partial [Paracoccaceae bacterium]